MTAETLQQIDRTKFIGASEIAAVMGLSRWKTPLSLWAEKTGKIPRSEAGEAAEWGNRLESVVSQKFAEKNGMKLMAYKKRYIHDDYEFLSCELDRIVVGSEELVEVKTCSAYLFKEWDAAEVPLEYVLQVNFQLGLSGRKTGYFAVLIGGQKYIEKKINFDQDLYNKQIEAAVHFWNEFVLKDVPPQAMSGDSETLIALFPTSNAASIAFEGTECEEINGMLHDRLGALEAIRHAEEEIEKIEVAIKQRLGLNEIAETDSFRITWKTQKRTSVDTAKLKEAGLYELYCKFSETRVFKANDKNKGVLK